MGQNYTTKIKPTWCPGCGLYSVHAAIKKALEEEELETHNVAMTFDIGCNGNMADKLNLYGLKSLHGRALPAAVGIQLANPNLTVLSMSGDGGTLNEGIQHLVAAAKSNYDITFIMTNNKRFGLTKGQHTGATQTGTRIASSPEGVIESRLNAAQIVLASNGTFVARTGSFDLPHMTETIRKAMEHKGFSFVEILQTCPTYNKENTMDWYKERVEHLNQPTQSLTEAFKTSAFDKKLKMGILYQKEKKTFTETYQELYRKKTSTVPTEEVREYEIKKLLEEFK